MTLQLRLPIIGDYEEGHFFIPGEENRRRLISYLLVDYNNKPITEEELDNLKFFDRRSKKVWDVGIKYLNNKDKIIELTCSDNGIWSGGLTMKFSTYLENIVRAVSSDKDEAEIRQLLKTKEELAKNDRRAEILNQIQKLTKELGELK